MGAADYWLPGAWNFICDQCGEKFKSTKAQFEWDGLTVCRQCLDPRHPQDFIRPFAERPVPWVRASMDPCIPPVPPPPVVIQPRFVDFPFAVGGTFVG